MDNTSYGAAPPQPDTNYPEQGYGAQYPNYTPQPGTCPPTADQPYTTTNNPSQVEPMESSQIPPTASENVPNAPNPALSSAQPSETGQTGEKSVESPHPTQAPPAAEVPVPAVPADNTAAGDQNTPAAEKTLDAAAEKPAETDESKNSSSEPADVASTE